MAGDKLFVDITASTKGINASLDNVGNRFGTLANKSRKMTVGMNGLGSSIGKLGGMLTAVKAVAAGSMFMGFVKSATDMVEVTNLFGVSLGDMTEKANANVQAMNKAFSLDTTKLQSAVGNYALLARSMGMSSTQAEMLGTTTSKLAVDLSSLTNVPIEQVMQDLRSGLVGQSETVYKYGIDVTEAGIKSEALAQGITKSVRNMSQGEKMALRYATMLRQTTLAQGDFARTIEQPANQMKIFTELITTLSRTIGTIFLPALGMILPYVNAVVKVLIDVFGWLAKLVGYKPPEFPKLANSIGGVSDSADSATEAVGGTTGAVKKLKQALMGIDEINLMPQEAPATGGGGVGGGGVGGASILPEMDLSGYDNGLTMVSNKTEEIANRIKELAKGAGNSLVMIWNSQPIQAFFFAVKSYLTWWYELIKQVSLNIFGNIQETWSNIYDDVYATIFNIVGLGEVMMVQIGMKINEYSQPIIDGVVGVFNSIWETAIGPLIEYIAGAWADVTNIMFTTWDNHGKRLLDNVGQFAVEFLKLFQSIYDNLIKPIIEPMLETLGWLWDTKLKFLVEKVQDFVMKLVNGAMELWNKFFSPLIRFLLEYLQPSFSSAMDFIMDVFGTLFGVVSDVLGGILDALGGVIDFIVGVFTGNWKQAFDGLIAISEGVRDAIAGIFKGMVNLVIDAVNFMIRSLNKIKAKFPDWIPGDLAGKEIGFNIPTIPKLARGGSLGVGQLFQAGEFGKAELVGSYNNKTTVMPLENSGFVEAMSKAVYGAVSSALNTTSASGGDLILKIGETEFGRVAIESINQVVRQDGTLALKV